MVKSGWAVAIACAMLFGCATAGTESAKAPSVDVTRVWAGTFTWPYGVSPMTLTLRQTGAEVTGGIATTGTVGEMRQGNGPVQGTVSGDALSITFSGGSANLFVKANHMSGFSSSASRWTLQRQ
jgi:hypothetical protein